MNVMPITPHIGAEIRGLDLSISLDNEAFAGVHQAFLDWGVLVFREQELSRDQHKSFARRFGNLHTHPMNNKGTGDPEVLVVKTTEDSAYTAGDGWHTDVTCDEYPPMGSMLYMKQVPGYGGGDTMYADMYLAYDMLSEAMKKLLNNLVAVHDGALPYVGAYKSKAPQGGYPKNEHPVIVTHPETGRKVLYVNSGFTSHIKG
jgi:taurine dioxygenase